MSTFDEKVRARLDELIEMGKKVLSTRYTQPPVAGEWISDTTLLTQWHTSCINFLSRALGDTTAHFRNFPKNCRSAGEVKVALGVLYSVKDDIEKGFLFERDQLVKAEVFEDILEQAEYLVAHGFAQAAASLAGAVLESDLRNLCRLKNIPLTDNDTLETLRVALLKGEIINPYEAEHIRSWGTLRNAADHGKWKEEGYGKSEARKLITDVREFSEKHLPKLREVP